MDIRTCSDFISGKICSIATLYVLHIDARIRCSVEIVQRCIITKLTNAYIIIASRALSIVADFDLVVGQICTISSSDVVNIHTAVQRCVQVVKGDVVTRSALLNVGVADEAVG